MNFKIDSNSGLNGPHYINSRMTILSDRQRQLVKHSLLVLALGKCGDRAWPIFAFAYFLSWFSSASRCRYLYLWIERGDVGLSGYVASIKQIDIH